MALDWQLLLTMTQYSYVHMHVYVHSELYLQVVFLAVAYYAYGPANHPRFWHSICHKGLQEHFTLYTVSAAAPSTSIYLKACALDAER